MGQDTLTLSQISGSNGFIINRPCDRSQLLVTLRKNDNDWLSPVGWVESEKGTLLDCRAKGDQTEVDIPAEYAGAIKSGDTLYISCFELDFEDQLKWKAPSTAKASGFLGRLTGSKTEPEIVKSDAERRAAEATKAAQSVRSQMERAQAAKDEAHRRAQEAARLAEQARLAEEKQIAEMEKASLALAEAEEHRAAEQASLDEERRVEELRRQEEARRAEEARQLEMERRRQAALKAEREKLSGELATAQAKRDESEGLLSKLSRDMHDLSIATQSSEKTVGTARDAHDAAQAELAKRQKSYDTAKAKYEAVTANIAAVNQTLKASEQEREHLVDQVVKAQTAHEKAEKLAQDAIAKAKDMKGKLDAVTASRAAMSAKVTELGREVSTLGDAAKASLSTSESARKSYEKSAGKLAKIEGELSDMSAQYTTLKASSQDASSDLSAVQTQLETLIERELTTKAAIALIDRGGDLDSVREMLSGVSETKALNLATEAGQGAKALKATRARAKKQGSRRALNAVASFGRKTGAASGALAAGVSSKASAMTKPSMPKITMPKLSAAKTQKAQSSPATLDSGLAKAKLIATEMEMDERSANDNSKSTIAILMASAAALAIVGVVGYAATRGANTAPDVTQSASVIQKTTVLSAPAIKADNAKEIEPAGLPPIELPELKPEEKAKPAAKVDVKPKAAADAKAKPEPKSAPEPKPAPKAVKTAAAPKPAAKPAAPKVAAVIAAPAPAPEPQSTALMESVQSDLNALGFYNGAIDGLSSQSALDAVRDFKNLFGLPENGALDNDFIRELKTARASAEASQAAALAQAEVDAKARAEAAAAVIYAPKSVMPAPEIEPTQTVSLAPVVPVALPEPDEIVQAKRISAIAAEYPSLARRRGFEKNVEVMVVYDVDQLGRVVNIVVEDITNAGTYTDEFKQAATDAVQGQKFSAKTVNGDVVLSRRHASKIMFRQE